MSVKFAIFIVGILVPVTLLSVSMHERNPMPDFSAIGDIQQRKQVFFDYLAPMVKAINSRRAMERQQLKTMHADLLEAVRLSYLQQRQIKFWAQRYDVDFDRQDLTATVEKLLMHLDAIPSSMVLAQAAMESAWGTSRFVAQGYNFFGQWCYQEGCGFVPAERPSGATHEVKKFTSTEHALYAYFRNINSHRAYRKARQIRAQMRQQDKPLSGLDMVAGLRKYSQRGQDYIDELRSVIRYNNLE